MIKLSVIVAAGTQCLVPADGCRSHGAGPDDDDDDDDETPIGDPPDDDSDDDWDDDDDEDDEDDEEPLQAIDIAPQHRLLRAVAAQ